MARSFRARLMDMEEAIAGIETILAETSFEQFAANQQAQWAVERALEIISEASRAIPDTQKALCAHIAWPRIAALGNVLRHEYQRVEARLVWNIARENLPELAQAVRTMKVAAD